MSGSTYIIPTGNEEKNLEIFLFLRNLPFTKLLITVSRYTQCICLTVTRLSWIFHRKRLRGAGRIGMRAAGIDRSPEWRHCSSEKQKWLQYQKWKLCFATRELIHQTQALRIICSSWKFLQAEWWLVCFRLVENLLNHGTGGNTVFNRVLCCTLTFHYTGGQLTACWAGGSWRTPASAFATAFPTERRTAEHLHPMPVSVPVHEVCRSQEIWSCMLQPHQDSTGGGTRK